MRSPQRPEIDHRTIKLLVGLVALTLAFVTKLFATAIARPLTSISESYWAGGRAQIVFIGFLFVVAALLAAYNGRSRAEMVASKVAAVAAFGVAFFPCACNDVRGVPRLHYGSAAVLFLLLIFFCYQFFRRATAKGYPEAQSRAVIYAMCGILIAAAVTVLIANQALGHPLDRAWPDVTFYGEATALMAFGVSWLTASRVLPVITRADERFSLTGESSRV